MQDLHHEQCNRSLPIFAWGFSEGFQPKGLAGNHDNHSLRTQLFRMPCELQSSLNSLKGVILGMIEGTIIGYREYQGILGVCGTAHVITTNDIFPGRGAYASLTAISVAGVMLCTFIFRNPFRKTWERVSINCVITVGFYALVFCSVFFQSQEPPTIESFLGAQM